jgi:hypothetical protein
MYDKARISSSMCLAAALLLAGCEEPEAGSSTGTGPGMDVGDESETLGGDGDESETTGGPPVCDPPSPYMGGWDIGCCQDEIAPQNGWSPGGVGVGTIMPDYTFTDQFGEAVRLYDFCHDAVWFEYVALW